MEIPTSTAAVAVAVALVVPGLVYAGTRAVVTGYRGTDKSLSARLVEAITVSVILNAVYLRLFGRLPYDPFQFSGVESVSVTDPAGAGNNVLLFGLLLPAIAATVIHALPWNRLRMARWAARRLSRFGVVRVTRIPTAWDFMGRTRAEGFIRITRADGTTIGGWYERGSFMSGYPEQRDIYIAEQWELGGDGSFRRSLEQSDGLWVSVRDDDIIEWLKRERG